MSGNRRSMRFVGSVSWFQMVPEILDLILQKLDLPDYLHFGKVCASWRSVFLSRCNITHPPPCMMLIQGTQVLPVLPVMLPLWCLYEGQFIKLQSPRLKSVGGSNQFFVGSYMGWLAVTCKIKPGIQLTNFTTNESISLPSMAFGGFEMRNVLNGTSFTIIHVVMSTDPTSDNCILVARGWHGSRLRSHSFAWCRVGDPEWTIFHLPVENLLTYDMVFHKGALYVLARDGGIFVYAFDPQPKMIDRSLVEISNIHIESFCVKLVESCEELFSVVRDSVSTKWYAFRMLNNGQWTRVESLGDRAFLIGRHSGRSYCNQELMGSSFEANCIYYCMWPREQFVRKFFMADGSNQEIPLPCGKGTPSIEWIRPETW